MENLLARGPEVLGNLWDKVGRAGRLEMMREVIYDIISALRVDGMHERREFNSVGAHPPTDPVGQPIDLLAIGPAYDLQYRLYVGQAK